MVFVVPCVVEHLKNQFVYNNQGCARAYIELPPWGVAIIGEEQSPRPGSPQSRTEKGVRASVSGDRTDVTKSRSFASAQGAGDFVIVTLS